MRPVDPELIRRSGAVKGAIVVTVFTGLVAAGAAVLQAATAAAVISRAFLRHEAVSSLGLPLTAFALAWLLRSTANAVQDVWARRAGLRAVAALRQEVADAYTRSDAGATAMFPLLSRGIDALEVYVARYLPQLVLAVMVPAGLGAWMLRNDGWTAVVLLITIPLIPVFMALIGWFTDAAVTKQWTAVGRITDVIGDLFTGLPDLIIFDRARAQAEVIRKLGTDATHATMRVLRISFLSSFALELIATISVAIMALGIGLRLTSGHIDLETGLMILILAPDVYLPLRLVGTQFHAAVEGMEAWNQAVPLLTAPRPAGALLSEPITSLNLDGLVCGYDSALHEPLMTRFERGTLTAITGHSGVGKSTLLRTIAGLVPPRQGSVSVNGQPVHALDQRGWFARVGYVPQEPWLGHGSVRDALAAGTEVSDAACREALDRVGLQGLSLEARIDDFSGGVSVGQRRRIALARYRLRDCEVLLLDEPTAAVDAESESAILDLLEEWRAHGTIVITVAHRAALVQAATDVIHLGVAR